MGEKKKKREKDVKGNKTKNIQGDCAFPGGGSQFHQHSAERGESREEKAGKKRKEGRERKKPLLKPSRARGSEEKRGGCRVTFNIARQDEGPQKESKEKKASISLAQDDRKKRGEKMANPRRHEHV